MSCDVFFSPLSISTQLMLNWIWWMRKLHRLDCEYCCHSPCVHDAHVTKRFMVSWTSAVVESKKNIGCKRWRRVRRGAERQMGFKLQCQYLVGPDIIRAHLLTDLHTEIQIGHYLWTFHDYATGGRLGLCHHHCVYHCTCFERSVVTWAAWM